MAFYGKAHIEFDVISPVFANHEQAMLPESPRFPHQAQPAMVDEYDDAGSASGSLYSVS